VTLPASSGQQASLQIREEHVSFRNGDVTLAGTLLTPCTDRPCPGVALVHGSGDETRDGYCVFANSFAARGIATLIYDKRGVGASTGHWRAGGFTELAEDARAGLLFLASHEGVDPQRTGLCGVSEGGWVVARAAASRASVRFVVGISAAGMSPARQERYRRAILADQATGFGALRALRKATTLGMFGALRLPPMRLLPGLAGYFARTMDYDPLPWWEAIDRPILLVYGEADATVPARESAARIVGARLARGGVAPTVYLYPEADHAIRVRDSQTGTWSFAPTYLNDVAIWILSLHAR
jgi:fermentation-respiration switch protein FrsA (DUF1100 family)